MANRLIKDRQKAAGDGQAGAQADARYFRIGNGLNATAHDIIQRCVHIIENCAYIVMDINHGGNGNISAYLDVFINARGPQNLGWSRISMNNRGRRMILRSVHQHYIKHHFSTGLRDIIAPVLKCLTLAHFTS